MIPASYLFKDVYHQHWEEPEPLRHVVGKPSFFSGLMTPLAGVLETVLTPRTRAARHHRGHAYE
ncbi:MAG: hypothetical protein WBA73_19820 [Devosia sp.]